MIIPARNEARNIERCVRSVLSTTYPNLEVIVVDDHSSDGTGDIARRIAASDARLAVIPAPDLPPGWFGKQWACASGARLASGSLLCFTDADTTHAPDLLPRAVNEMRARHVDLLTVAGAQEMRGFWERIIQPQLFALLSVRYGGTEHVSRAKRPTDAIANGQFILVRRGRYVAMGGHELVRDLVAEDMAMAQEWVRGGRHIALLMGRDQLSTHMYSGYREARVRLAQEHLRQRSSRGARRPPRARAVSGRSAADAAFGARAADRSPSVRRSASFPARGSSGRRSCTCASVGYWALLYLWFGQPLWYALLYPLGSLVLLIIAGGALRRGRKSGVEGARVRRALTPQSN